MKKKLQETNRIKVKTFGAALFYFIGKKPINESMDTNEIMLEFDTGKIIVEIHPDYQLSERTWGPGWTDIFVELK